MRKSRCSQAPSHQAAAGNRPDSQFLTIANSLQDLRSKPSATVPLGPSESAVAQATQAVKEHGPAWMAHGNVIGVGVGAADENPYEAVVVVYIDRTQGNVPDLPDQARGFRLKRVLTDPFVALGCCEACR